MVGAASFEAALFGALSAWVPKFGAFSGAAES
jgi:hypothetical protein